MNEYKEKLIAANLEILKSYADEDHRPWQIAYSGGKDSSVATSVIFRAIERIPVTHRKRRIILTTSSTGLDLTTEPTKQRELMKMRKYIEDKEMPIDIVEVKPELKDNFIVLVLGRGYPLPKSRTSKWCTTRLKIKPMNIVKKELNAGVKVMGVRMSETVQRGESIKKHQVDLYHGSDGELYPIVAFTLEDVWEYSLKEGYAWGDAEEVSQLYKDATGECGLSKKKAGAGEKIDDPCGARFGCVICPVVTIDKSTREMAKKHPWFEPFVDLRDKMIDMYKIKSNRAGFRRDGTEEGYGKGNFNIRARMELFNIFKQAEEDHKYLCYMHGIEPQMIFTEEIEQAIFDQWQEDENERPWLKDAEPIGRIYEMLDIQKIRDEDGKVIRIERGYQSEWNIDIDTPGA